MAREIRVTEGIRIRAPTLHQVRRLWRDMVGDGAVIIKAKRIELTVCSKVRKAK